MALREVLQYPDPLLKRVSEPVEQVTDELRELANDMCEVMYDEPGIGLAAPQVGEAVRLIVVDTEWTEDGNDRNPLIVVNPALTEPEDKVIWNEGCLSVPDFQADVERAATITLRGTDLDGEPIEERASGLRAVCFQHEIDHLEGILFIDRISRLKRGMYAKKRRKQLRLEEQEAGPGRGL
jgi:peptide deformylase